MLKKSLMVVFAVVNFSLPVLVSAKDVSGGGNTDTTRTCPTCPTCSTTISVYDADDVKLGTFVNASLVTESPNATLQTYSITTANGTNIAAPMSLSRAYLFHQNENCEGDRYIRVSNGVPGEYVVATDGNLYLRPGTSGLVPYQSYNLMNGRCFNAGGTDRFWEAAPGDAITPAAAGLDALPAVGPLELVVGN